MAISYVSDVIKSNPWIQPFDIDLMAKVNTYKQGEFYRNAQKTENMISQLNNADIANADQREYLKSKVGNLTKQLQGMGAVNYSDINISNAIEGFGSEIYQDEKVLNGISSTKSIREWQANVQKMKTDPKLNKFYNGANEAYDYEHYIKPYVNGGIDAKYEGPRAPKPYTGNPFVKVLDQLKKLHPDIDTRIDPVTNNPYFFSKSENKRLTPERISAAIDGVIDGDTKQQLQIDSWYNYDYSTGNKFTKQMGLDIYSQDVDNAAANKKEELRILNEQITAEPDLNKKAAYESRRKEVESQINTYSTKRDEMIKIFSKDYDADPKSAKYKLYMTRFQKDLVKAAGFSEEKITLIRNEQQMVNARMQLEFIKEGLHWDGVHYNADGTPLVQPIPNAQGMTAQGKADAAAKAKGGEKVQISDGIFHDLASNSENDGEARDNKVNESTLLADNNIIDAELTGKLRTYLETSAKRGGYDLGFKTTPESNPGATPVVSASPLLEAIQSFGNKSVLDREDVQTFLNKVGNSNSVNINYNGKQLGVTKGQIDFIRNIMKNWDAVATGQLKSDDAPMNISVSELSQFVNEYQTLDMVKRSNLAYINNVKNQALGETGLNAQQIARYRYFLDNKKGQGRTEEVGWSQEGGPEFRYTEDGEWTKLKKLSKIDHSSVNKKIKAAFDNASNRDNYYTLYLPKPEILEKAAPGLMNKVRNAAINGVEVMGVKVKGGDVRNLTPVSIGREANGIFVLTYSFGEEKATNIGKVQLSAEEARGLGGQLYPDEPLERLLTYEKSTGPLYTYSGAFKQPIKYSIEREGNNRNSRTYIPYIYYNGEPIPIFAIDKQGFQGSANAAKHLLTQYINNNSATTMEEFIAGAKLLRNQ